MASYDDNEKAKAKAEEEEEEVEVEEEQQHEVEEGEKKLVVGKKVKGFLDYGWIWVNKITNSTNVIVIFKNPNKGKEGTISPGTSNRRECCGLIPYDSYSERYTIKYKNTALDDWVDLSMSDLGEGWKLKLVQSGLNEDERSVRPVPNHSYSEIDIELFNEYDGFDTTYSGYRLNVLYDNKAEQTFSNSKKWQWSQS